MVAGGEHRQLRAAIEVLVPYTSQHAEQGRALSTPAWRGGLAGSIMSKVSGQPRSANGPRLQ
jgi:hypothetical protein